jgi:hypothetical protein
VSRAKEEVTFDRARVTSLAWASYPISTLPEILDVDSATARFDLRRTTECYIREKLDISCQPQ